MKGLKKLSELSKIGRVPLYYSISNDTVYNESGDGRYHLTDLINYNTPKEIEKTVVEMLARY